MKAHEDASHGRAMRHAWFGHRQTPTRQCRLLSCTPFGSILAGRHRQGLGPSLMAGADARHPLFRQYARLVVGLFVHRRHANVGCRLMPPSPPSRSLLARH